MSFSNKKVFNFAERTTSKNPTPRKESIELICPTVSELDLTDAKTQLFLNQLIEDSAASFYKSTWSDKQVPSDIQSIDDLIVDTATSRGIPAEYFTLFADAFKAWLDSKGKQGPIINTLLTLVKRKFKNAETVDVKFLEAYLALITAFANNVPEVIDEHGEVLGALSNRLNDLINTAKNPASLDDLIQGL